MKKDYKFGDYYSPLDVIKIAKMKLKQMKWSVLLLPIHIILFLLNFLLSSILYPLFILNKYFCHLGISGTAKTLVIAKIIAALADFLHDVFYIFYCLFMPVHRLLILAYMACPNTVVYYSNQTALMYANEVADIKEKYRIEFYQMVEESKKRVKVTRTEEETAEFFEQEFFITMNNAIAQKKVK